jgi:hypothetical protein
MHRTHPNCEAQWIRSKLKRRAHRPWTPSGKALLDVHTLGSVCPLEHSRVTQQTYCSHVLGADHRVNPQRMMVWQTMTGSRGCVVHSGPGDLASGLRATGFARPCWLTMRPLAAEVAELTLMVTCAELAEHWQLQVTGPARLVQRCIHGATWAGRLRPLRHARGQKAAPPRPRSPACAAIQVTGGTGMPRRGHWRVAPGFAHRLSTAWSTLGAGAPRPLPRCGKRGWQVPQGPSARPEDAQPPNSDGA